MRKDILDSQKIIQTISKLSLRIEDRFPDSGLLLVCRELLAVAQETDKTVRWIRRPNLPVRIFSALAILFIFASLAFTISLVRIELGNLNLSDLITLSEAALNEIIILGAVILFIITFETRRKRQRVINAINRLRSIAHVIDAHQLTKDPDSMAKRANATRHSPKRTMDAYQLGRYLDYCSEMLALTSKVAFLYVQRFDDPIANNSVNDIEQLTTGLSRKIWQKIMLVKEQEMVEKLGSQEFGAVQAAAKQEGDRPA